MTRHLIKILFLLLTITQIASCGVFKTGIPFRPAAEHHNDLPKPTGYVNDFESIFSRKEKKALTAIIKSHEKQTTNQIALVTIKSYKPYSSLMDYSVDLANYWGVGQKNKNNGIVIVFGKEIREIWISNGSGIEAKLTDFETKKIIDEVILPEFKQGNYFLGSKKGLLAIIDQLEE